jgi:hypothetical protein
MAQEILIIGIPNVVQWGEAGNQSGGHSKKVHVHTLRQTYATHLLEDSILSRSKTFWDIRTLNFARTLFSCGFTLPDSINSLAIHQNSLHTLFEATWKRCNNLAKPKKFRQE